MKIKGIILLHTAQTYTSISILERLVVRAQLKSHMKGNSNEINHQNLLIQCWNPTHKRKIQNMLNYNESRRFPEENFKNARFLKGTMVVVACGLFLIPPASSRAETHLIY